MDTHQIQYGSNPRITSYELKLKFIRISCINEPRSRIIGHQIRTNGPRSGVSVMSYKSEDLTLGEYHFVRIRRMMKLVKCKIEAVIRLVKAGWRLGREG